MTLAQRTIKFLRELSKKLNRQLTVDETISITNLLNFHEMEPMAASERIAELFYSEETEQREITREEIFSLL